MAKIILFDGVCNMCNSAIQQIIKHDTNNVFKFAALQSEAGLKLINERKIDTNTIDSIILIEPGVAYYTKSTAALHIGKDLKRYATLSSIFLLLPLGLRDFVYDYIAKNRYKWYGKKESCMMPTPEINAKFLK